MRFLQYENFSFGDVGGKALDAVIVWNVIARYYSDYGTEVPIPFEKNIIWIPARRGPFHRGYRCAQIYPK